jgi:hypothetical protein
VLLFWKRRGVPTWPSPTPGRPGEIASSAVVHLGDGLGTTADVLDAGTVVAAREGALVENEEAVGCGGPDAS